MYALSWRHDARVINLCRFAIASERLFVGEITRHRPGDR